MRNTFFFIVAPGVCALTLAGCGGRTDNSGDTSPANEPAATRQAQQNRADVQASPESSRRVLGRDEMGETLVGEVSDLVADLGGRMTEGEIIVDLPTDVLFDFDKSEIRPVAVPKLETLARLIKQAGSGTIQVNGHADAIGNDAYNTGLSERRATSIVQWLTNGGGIDASRFQSKGYGESQPVVPNTKPDGSDDPEGRQKNRRVEVVIPRK